MVVELEEGVWLADGEGDPARTTIPENAKVFGSIKEACLALSAARNYRPFGKAVVASGPAPTEGEG